MEEDIYFITRLSRRVEDWPQFPEFPIGVSAETRLIYVQRYVRDDIVEPTEFQVASGQLLIDSFGREEVRCLSLIVTELAHYTFDGHHISFPLIYYVDSLVIKDSTNYVVGDIVVTILFFSRSLSLIC